MRNPILAVSLLVLAACNTTVSKQEMDSVDYGPAPTRFKEEILSYLHIRLVDPKEAIVEIRTEPKQLYQRKTPVRELQYGWGVCVWVNDKNKKGAYDGFYPVSFILRNEKIVAVNNGPDDFGAIGARYAREQCAQLGAPFVQLR
jgi:hypothetical protein